jgi:two-component system cell cycle sensor histidine kinase/response regulator CckA
MMPDSKILIVDDEPRMCKSLKVLLSEESYEVHTCKNGEDALKSLDENMFDLILLDIVIPDMDGRQIMDHITSRCPDTPVVLMTGHASVESAVTALRGGAYDYLKKPFEHEELLKTIRNALDQTRLHSERKKAEEDWENTFDAVTDMIMVLDSDHRIVRVNKATADALKTTKVSLEGKKCYEVMHGLSRPIKECPMVLTMKTLKSHTTEMTVPEMGGTFICSTSPILDREGKLTGYTHTLKDITQSKRLEAQLQQAQKMESIGTLAGGIAHDFNNLLMGILGHTSLMLLDIDSSHPHYKKLKVIEKQVQSGVKLTRQLLGYARQGRYEVTPIDLNQLAQETSETFGRTRKEITIQLQLSESLYAIEADHGQIEQVLLNLYVNAADAMPGGGDLIIKTINTTHEDFKSKLYDPKPGNYVLLTVTDTGVGMDKKTQKRIFEPFFTTKEMGRGTGLGLASVYGIIKGHNGHISVESKKGCGSTFSIYFPATDKKVRNTVKTSDRFVKETGTVLLVDDEAIMLEVGREMLEVIGYRALTANDGKEAVEVYKNNRDTIDVVLLDMVMPNMGGGETYDRLKEINPNIKVVLASGYAIDGEATKILERGCNGFIQKPFNVSELSQKLGKILWGR